MKISTEYPPNYQKIAEAFDLSEKEPIFTYGDTIYNPHKGGIDQPLIDHEEVHFHQQTAIGVKEWWDNYLKDPAFRLSQEVDAYRVHFKSAKKHYKDRNLLAKFLSRIAGDLSSPMYGNLVSHKEAIKLIKQ